MPAVAASGNAASSYVPSDLSTVGNKQQLQSTDFIKLLITQLQNQDPTKPMTNQEVLAQVTQIGTLQSQNALQTSLQDMTLQNQISSASGMIGKKVTGLAEDGSQLKGVVTSIKVVDKQVTLELDSGKSLKLARVTAVAQDTATAANPPSTGVPGETPWTGIDPVFYGPVLPAEDAGTGADATGGNDVGFD